MSQSWVLTKLYSLQLVTEEASKRHSELSARSLSNPLKDGKMFMKRGDFISGWKTKHFALMPDDDKLYCFDSVDVSGL